eukprot:2360265-Pyramimonas_sp.AAC.1
MPRPVSNAVVHASRIRAWLGPLFQNAGQEFPVILSIDIISMWPSVRTPTVVFSTSSLLSCFVRCCPNRGFAAFILDRY